MLCHYIGASIGKSFSPQLLMDFGDASQSSAPVNPRIVVFCYTEHGHSHIVAIAKEQYVMMKDCHH